ncbi:phage terminase large subunit-like protein [Agrobacterium larrymoorei]|uniref:Phage terminase large subunit-like protein n=1 Tax=Agrobacterium larrymoorei TaxID=160699 RepID=A0AAJ2B602_9HYPH|nr:terminase TerL endonuclease subunit [Agrobacterium larrymoorei]MDR6101023.1 phage terminase large subunit-like protein [Agrobacterium larrymoorei]
MANLSWISDDSPIDDPFGYGERAVQFLRLLKHPKSSLPGRAFQLDDWQERIVRRIYGPRHPDGRRIVRTVAMMLPRGNRKTSLGAALALLHTIGPENMPGGECMVAASDRSQARIAFKESFDIIEAGGYSNRLHLVDSKNRIRNMKTGSFFEAISADARTAHGHTPVFALVDELHAWPKRDLWEAIRSGLVKVPGSLLMVISTAGRGQENVAWEFYDYARKVQRGEIIDETVLPILFETPRDADWQDEEVWFAANPGLAHGYPDIAGLRQLAREAAQIPAEREAFKQLNLNMWLDHSLDPFVDMLVYDEGRFPVDLDELEGQPCWLGVDLSSTNDLTSVVACWGDSESGYTVHPWFFCPADNLRARTDRDKVPYVAWADDEFIIPTPGNVVDYRYVEDYIREICARFDVREIAFDPHLARNMLNNLIEDGLPAVEMRQGWVTMAPAVKEVERAILGRRFRHGGHPILRWNFDNIAVHTDAAGNRSFHKGKSKDRIDGAVASAMAVARCAAGDSNKSSYDNFDGDIEEWSYA